MAERYPSYELRKEFEELTRKGYEAYKERDYETGVEFFKQALEINPTDIYAQQCISQYYLMNGDYFNAKPICENLVHEGELSALSLRKFKSLSEENHDDVDDLILEQYIRVKAYEAIQRMCRADKEKENITYLKMRNILEEQGQDVNFRWYFYMIHNRINCEAYEEAWEYLEEAETKIKRNNERAQYASLLCKYSEEIIGECEQLRLLTKANELLQSDPYNHYLLELKQNIYQKLGMEIEQKELLMELKIAYEKILDEERFNRNIKSKVRKRLYFIRMHSAVSESLGLPKKYEHEVNRLLEKKISLTEDQQ